MYTCLFVRLLVIYFRLCLTCSFHAFSDCLCHCTQYTITVQYNVTRWQPKKSIYLNSHMCKFKTKYIFFSLVQFPIIFLLSLLITEWTQISAMPNVLTYNAWCITSQVWKSFVPHKAQKPLFQSVLNLKIIPFLNAHWIHDCTQKQFHRKND